VELWDNFVGSSAIWPFSVQTPQPLVQKKTFSTNPNNLLCSHRVKKWTIGVNQGLKSCKRMHAVNPEFTTFDCSITVF
jgi:hypothetical protein